MILKLKLDAIMKCPHCGENVDGDTTASDFTIQGWNAGTVSPPELCHECEQWFETRYNIASNYVEVYPTDEPDDYDE